MNDAAFTPSFPVTWAIIGLCTFFYLWSVINTFTYDSKVQAPFEQAMMYETPLQKPAWMGYEPVLLGEPDVLVRPSFTQIVHGEVWRLFTPVLLHANFLHILFNMLWLFALGRAMEPNMSKMGYIGFSLGGAALSNTCQYLVSGPFFVGYSGVLCAMLGYIWVRLKKAPWEPYLINRRSLGFLWFFIFLLTLISGALFVLSLYNVPGLRFPFANTAHMTGALYGLVVAKIKR
ncbi:MAG: hypothetical protein A3F09_00030 [Chlamydiae bacterium RIFCSPHIGHO2_12_FULL_49_11]|nr:MAG: hypothetical protein A3F09_00030 [Chlamydiae bacterium RIFCSPHIGHO2_12_FULL_49_11]